MKRFLLIPPFFLLVLLTACTNLASGVSISPAQWTAMVETQTATAWTPTPISTTDPYLATIITTLNEDLSKADPLGRTIDASYMIMNMTFQAIPDSPSKVFVVNVRCDCVTDDDCCLPARTFVMVADAMRRNPNPITAYVQSNVTEVKVVCVHKDIKIGAMSASWFDMKDYLLKNTVGYQFGDRVKITKP